jgi:hypothetical protein
MYAFNGTLGSGSSLKVGYDHGLPDRLLGLQHAVSTISEQVTQRLFAGSPPPQWSLKEPGA